jgi:hypothetical protein
MPDTAVFRFEVPEQFDMEVDDYISELRARQEKQECASRIERRDNPKRSVLGSKRLRQTRVGDAPKNREKWFRMRPNIAAKCRAARSFAIREMQQFRAEYARSRERWINGDREVIFPAGTWWLVRHAGANAAPS